MMMMTMDGITSLEKVSYVNSRRLRRSNREQTQPTYTKVTREIGPRYSEEPPGPEGPMDSYKSFLTKRVININAGDAKDCKISDDEMCYHIIGIVMAQYFSLKAGLKKFGVPGKKATTKILSQLHYMVTCIPIDPAKLTKADRLTILSSLMLLIEKRDGTVKARACAVGGKQRREGTNPTTTMTTLC